MKKIKTTAININVGMPVKKGTLDHLQAAYQEALEYIVLSNVQNATAATATPWIIYGVKNSTPATSTYTLSAGAIYYLGEIYLVSATTFTVTTGVPVCTITTTQYINGAEADPVTFTDNTSNNIHDIRKIVIAAGVSLSGDFDLSTAKYYGIWQTYVPVVSDATVSGGTISTVNSGSHISYIIRGTEMVIRYHLLCTVSSNNITQIKLNMATVVTAFDNGISQPNGVNRATTSFATNLSNRSTFENNNTHLVIDADSGVLATSTTLDAIGEITVQLS